MVAELALPSLRRVIAVGDDFVASSAHEREAPSTDTVSR
jgi:hypothetical protein